MVDREAWRRNAWYVLHHRAAVEIAALGETAAPFILVDEAAWEPGPIAGRRRILFLERDGEYAGLPEGDDQAIAEFERLRVERNDDGSVNHLNCATFIYTRVPYDPAAPIPGGHPADPSLK